MRVVALMLGLVVFVAVGLAVWRFSPAPQAVKVVQAVDYELTADCLSAHQSWRNFNSTLRDLERDLRFCVEVWPTAQLSAP